MNKYSKDHADSNVKFLLVCIEDTKDYAEMVKTVDGKYDIGNISGTLGHSFIAEDKDDTMKAIGLRFIPHMTLVGSDGKIVGNYDEKTSADDVKALADANPAKAAGGDKKDEEKASA